MNHLTLATSSCHCHYYNCEPLASFIIISTLHLREPFLALVQSLMSFRAHHRYIRDYAISLLLVMHGIVQASSSYTIILYLIRRLIKKIGYALKRTLYGL